MHVHVGQQGRKRAALRRAPPMSTASCPGHATRSVPFLNRHVEPETEQMQQCPIANPPRNRLQQVRLRNRVEIPGQVRVDDLGVSGA